MGRVGVALGSYIDREGMVPVQWRDLHVVDVGSPAARLYRAIVLDALQEVGRYLRHREHGIPWTAQRERARRELVAWITARDIAAYAYRVPFQRAMAFGFPGMDVESVRVALLAALGVRPASTRLHLTFDRRVLRRHYVRRRHLEEAVA
jgi:hypothetical protein